MGLAEATAVRRASTSCRQRATWPGPEGVTPGGPPARNETGVSGLWPPGTGFCQGPREVGTLSV